MMIEQNTNYAYKMKYMANPTFDKVRELSTKFYLELPQELKDELYEALHRGIDILDSEPQMTAYIFAYGKMHQAKLNYAFDKLSDNFFEQEEINIVDYGCGQAIGTMCYADFLRKNHYLQKVKTITLIEPSEICLKRAALHTSAFFPESEIKTVNKGFNDLNENDIICSEETPTLHILSNVLDILNFDIYNFAELIKNNLKGKNQFVCVAPYYNGNEKDNRMDLFASKINGSNIITRKYKANEFIPEKEWTCKISCFQKNIGSFEMIEDSDLDFPISADPQMTYESQSIDYAITSIKELRKEGFEVYHITSKKDNKKYLKIIKGSRFILLEDKISNTISDDAPLKVSIRHYNDNGKIRTVSLGKIENLDIENPNSEDLEQHTIYYEADEKLREQWIDENSISHEFANGKGKIKLKYSVTSIEDFAFLECTGLTSITIPNSITEIGDSAFSGCSGLISISLPNSVKNIGFNVFGGCSGLVEPIYNEHCFAYFPNGYATEYTIPNGIQQISGSAFEGCDKLTSITIPNSVKNIGLRVFCGCSGLVEPIYNEHCFAYFPNGYATEYTIPNGIQQISSSAFEGCDKLTSITIPNSITEIGDWAFSECSGLISISLPNSVKNIGLRVFSGCSGLKSITIPSSVMSVGCGAFASCDSLQYNEYDNAYYLGNDKDKYVVLVKAISSDITSCNITPNCKIIYLSAFLGCSKLTSITIPNSITKIGEAAFGKCIGLKSIVISKSVTEIDRGAFIGCFGLESINVENGNARYDSRNKCNAIIETAKSILISGCKNTTILESVSEIGNWAFRDCCTLSSIAIPNKVTKIGYCAFEGCSNLCSIVIPDSVTEIKMQSFRNCTSLTSIKISNSITKIEAHTFSGCKELTSVVIPDSVKEIDWGAFRGCTGLIAITIPYSVTNIGMDAFRDCTELSSIMISDSVTEIGNNAFEGCESLKEIIIHEGTREKFEKLLPEYKDKLVER